MSKPIAPARRAHIRAWLKARGHKPADVDGKPLNNTDNLRRAVCDLHGLAEADYLAVMR